MPSPPIPPAYSNYPGLPTFINAISINEGYGLPGTVATSANNPGDIRGGNAAGLGTIGGENQTVYPDIQTGTAALASLVVNNANNPKGAYAQFGPNITVGQFMSKFSTNPAAATGLAQRMGISLDTPLKQVLSTPQTLTNARDVSYNTTYPPGGKFPISTGNGTGEVASGLTRTATSAVPLSSTTATVSYASLFPDVIVNTGLDETPWYNDTNLVTGNPKIRNSVSPVVFEVVLKGRNYQILSTQGSTGTPIQVQLNASMKTFSVSSKHVFNPQRTRTGWHITMWGMQADTIEGNCTTGVFMNQFGLTDLFSTAQTSSQLLQLLASGFKDIQVNGQIESLLSVNANPAPNTSSAMMQQITGQSSTEAFRVAAQDAFTEFLFLFKNNGIVWLNNSADFKSNDERVAVDAWSPELSLSASAKNSRNNDVISRGMVLMKFKGTTYQGFFKSLNWNQDAANPFQWTFNFVFQVEKTLGYIFSPTG